VVIVLSWKNRRWASGFLDDAVRSLSEACVQLVYRTKCNPEDTYNDQPKTPDSATSVNENCFYYGIDEDQIHEESNDGYLLKFKRDIEREVNLFLDNFNNDETIASHLKSTKDFWTKNRLALPILYACTCKIVSIPASSAYIERFFSICGVVCKNRAMNMNDELIICKCMLKANMKLLDELNRCPTN